MSSSATASDVLDTDLSLMDPEGTLDPHCKSRSKHHVPCYEDNNKLSVMLFQSFENISRTRIET